VNPVDHGRLVHLLRRFARGHRSNEPSGSRDSDSASRPPEAYSCLSV